MNDSRKELSFKVSYHVKGLRYSSGRYGNSREARQVYMVILT